MALSLNIHTPDVYFPQPSHRDFRSPANPYLGPGDGVLRSGLPSACRSASREGAVTDGEMESPRLGWLG